MSKIVERYGSVESALTRLNELRSQIRFAKEAGVAQSTVTIFLRQNKVTRQTRWARPVDVVKVEIGKGA